MVPTEVPHKGLTFVVTGTYNEATNIQTLIQEVMKHDVHLVVVDDNSPDGTAVKVKELQQHYKNLHLIERPGKLGYGTAYADGFRYSIEKGATKIVSIDADLSHDPKILPEMISMDKDIVIGSRYIPGGGTSWTLYRRIVSKGANTLARLFLGLPVRDVTSGYRLYKKAVLEAIELDKVKSDGYSFLQEILYKAHKKGFSIGEVAIFFQDRREGQSKLSKKEMIKFFFNLVRLRLSKHA
ncbi:MAG: polyprenol monophosphomannose synthase [Candidatus Woesearchaeota archaeon]|jgi:dolichol-phosphate mannosyltransferase|nr:polyprenol monophosphomannose synthase [Candidatus Woesearchaeota archaeon]MDP7198344.1 polyprenol monophosphomannose synthase [Candidatus Woesearchaeota archaeon]MDP7467446.1 polyprenol monophosphomannose synthase [Candidatus Woesearchaeota archaeon]MDP7647673.1 polyprenol monophosphomannose synthase [Candidatus Woesearchaeota archaeon]